MKKEDLVVWIGVAIFAGFTVYDWGSPDVRAGMEHTVKWICLAFLSLFLFPFCRHWRPRRRIQRFVSRQRCAMAYHRLYMQSPEAHFVRFDRQLLANLLNRLTRHASNYPEDAEYAKIVNYRRYAEWIRDITVKYF